MKRVFIVVGAIVIILAIVLGVLWHEHRDELTVELPTYPPFGKAVWLDQNWTAEQRDWFHHADQGTQTFGIPYEWFVALEQPSLSLSDPGLLSDTTVISTASVSFPTRVPEIGIAGWLCPRRPSARCFGRTVTQSPDECANDFAGPDLRCVPHRPLYLSGNCRVIDGGVGSYECPEFPEGRWAFHRLHAMGARPLLLVLPNASSALELARKPNQILRKAV